MRARIGIGLGTGVLAFCGLAALAAGARAGEEKVPLDKVPAAVMKAIKARFPGSRVNEAGKETEGGTITYEVGLTHDGHKVDVALKADGMILEVETEVPAADLPAAVAGALKAKYPKAKVKKAEEVRKGGKTTYEVHVADGGTSRGVVFDASGKILKAEEGDED